MSVTNIYIYMNANVTTKCTIKTNLYKIYYYKTSPLITCANSPREIKYRPT